jgi:hypothetical protein
MRIIFLNTWSGKTGKDLLEFISKESSNVCAFCLSEVTPDLFKKLQGVLNDFQGYFALDKKLKNSKTSQAIFVSNKFPVLDYKKSLLYGPVKSAGGIEVPGFIQAVVFNGFMIFNLQGMAYPGDKLDTEERLEQSRKILGFAEKFPDPKIIGGDFNLMPNIQSINLFEDAGYKNLIKDFKITTTRNNLADHTKNDKQYFGKQNFADYCFVLPEVKVKSFEVPNIEVSDHLPLILDFEI